MASPVLKLSSHLVVRVATDRLRCGRGFRGALCTGIEAPVENVEALLRTCPKSATAKDAAGRLPLHLAIETSASAGMLLALIRAHPAAAAERDGKRDGCFPLQLCISGGRVTREVAQALIRAHPPAAREVDKAGRCLLHNLTAQFSGFDIGDKVRQTELSSRASLGADEARDFPACALTPAHADPCPFPVRRFAYPHLTSSLMVVPMGALARMRLAASRRSIPTTRPFASLVRMECPTTLTTTASAPSAAWARLTGI